jgi:TonB-linked SusC/RagA family outer membrane protein
MKKCILIFTLVCLISSNLSAQLEIGGQVKNTSGEPIPGVNILIKGTMQGTVTDINGNFTISDVPANGILVFSYVGMLSKEVNVGNRTQIDVTMEEDILDLEGVVVIGYGMVRKRDLTGSVASVKTNEIVKAPTRNPLEAIQGMVPGVDITRNSGTAGSGANIVIRGNRSIHGSNSPLFIIDGIQGGSFGDQGETVENQGSDLIDLNANDIESIEVLKDASATAIYGSQGANGVVIITTKKGASGKTRVSYNGYYGINGLTPYPKARLGEDYIELRREAYRTAGLWNDTVDDPEDYAKLFPNGDERTAVDSNQWIDWPDLLFRNGIQQNHQLSVSGGTEKTKSYFSVGYYKEEGVVRNDDMTRYNARLNVDHTINKWIEAGMKAQLTYYDQNRRKDPLSKSTSTTPLGVPYDEDGNINLYPVAGSSSTISLLTDERPDIAKDNSVSTNVLINGYIDLTPVKGLTFRSNLGVNLGYERRGIYNAATSLSQKDLRYPTASMTNDNTKFVNWDNILTYSREIGDHSLTVTAITSYTRSDYDEIYASGNNQVLSSQLFYNLGATDVDDRLISSRYIGTKTMSYAGRLNYSYRGKYLLTVTERFDGASRLAPGNQWDHFPSVAVAWRMSDERFMETIETISSLKLRLSYGIAGNSGITPYGTQSSISYKAMGFGDEPAAAYEINLERDIVGNSALGWEKSATINLGLDLALFRNRLSTTVDIYSTKTTDILLERSLPQSTGVPSVYQNIGSTLNRGIELSINSVNVHTNSFKWTSAFTFARNKEEITDLIEGQDIIDQIENSLIIGKPIHSFYTWKKLGIWQLGEEEEAAQFTGDITFEPGDIKLANLNNDSTIDEDDRTCIGAAVPDWVGGLQNTFTYKSLELSIYLFARWGQMINAEFLGRYNPGGKDNGPASHDYWTPDNPTNDFPRPDRAAANITYYYGYQTLNYVDGSYFKVKNVTLAYTLPESLTSKVLIDKIRLYATASNLYTYTKSHLIREYDPERGGSEKFPLSKQIVFGLNIEF